MTEQILSLLNPIRILKVQDWMKIAEHLTDGLWGKYNDCYKVIRLQSRFEELASKPLTKEMFVCGVEKPLMPKPSNSFNSNTAYEFQNQEKDYQAALKSVWFDGVKLVHETGGFSLHYNDEYNHIEIAVHPFGKKHLHINGNFVGYVDTLFSLLYHITKYNETYTKIDLRFTESFAEELLK